MRERERERGLLQREIHYSKRATSLLFQTSSFPPMDTMLHITGLQMNPLISIPLKFPSQLKQFDIRYARLPNHLPRKYFIFIVPQLF